MTRRLKKKQIGPWCSFCEGKVRAVYRDEDFRLFGCDNHAKQIDEKDKLNRRMNYYETEGERQAIRGFWR